MRLTILGNNSALPAFGRHPTSQIVSIYGEYLLIDCGEGTQVQMQRFGMKWRKLQHIFISHMHGDHYFGLPGLINSMSLLGRTQPLHLYAPAALEPIINQIQTTAESEFCYPFFFHPLPEGKELLVETDTFKVSCFPVQHRIPCHGFLVESKSKGRKILPQQCREQEIPRYFYDKLKQGEDYTHKDGRVVKNEDVTTDPPQAKKYAYCADSLYTEDYMDSIQGVDMMYHEATYLHDNAEKAAMRFHSTAQQAAELAVKAGVKRLLLGHYSSKYKDLDPFKEEAKAVFPNADISIEGNTYDV